MENKCPLCGAYCYDFVVCANCLKKVQKDAMEETKKEFIKQCQLKEDEQNEIFQNAKWEVYHNNFYTNLTTEQYIQALKEEFIKNYHHWLVGVKLFEIKTGLKHDPKIAKEKKESYYNRPLSEKTTQKIENWINKNISSKK